MANKHRNEVPKLAEESENLSNAEEKNIESRFECPICLTWLKDPLLTSCGHKFCSRCITTWLSKEGACCPVDSKPLDPDKDLFEDRYTSREISQQRTNCPYQQFGCELQLSPVEMEKHVQESHALLCTFADFGCKEKFQNKDDLKRHMDDNINDHLMMTGNALTKLNATQSQINARALESKLWDPPPKNGTGTTTDNQPPPDWQHLVKNLYERIVLLEQQNRELSIMITNQETKLTNQQTKLTTLQTSIRFNNDETILRDCKGIYIWRLNTFSEKLIEMSNDPLRMFYSPGFYTSPNGYKICARINVSSKDPEFLSILLHMMQSENDDALDWPFDGTICFVLVHPQNSEKSIREKTTSRPDLEAFRKPVCDLNKRSFGYTEFVKISELTDFLKNDCLIFRIEVRPHDRLDDCQL